MIRTMTLADALYVVSHMRDMDRACVSAVAGDMGDEDFAANRWGTNGPAWTLCKESGEPIAIFGLSLHGAPAWWCVAWLVATDAFGLNSARKLARHARIVLGTITNPASERYMRRIEAHVLSHWTEARRFAAHLGLTHEGTRRNAGRNGEDIETWAIA